MGVSACVIMSVCQCRDTVRAHHLEAPETSPRILVLKGAAWKKDAVRCEGMEAILLTTCARFRQHDVHVILGDPFSSVFATLLQAQYLVTLYSAFSSFSWQVQCDHPPVSFWWQAQYLVNFSISCGGRSIWWTSSYGRRKIWWTSSSIFRGRRSIWTYISMFRGRHKEFEAPGGQTCCETLKKNVGIQRYENHNAGDAFKKDM